jgi:hypothetical protein
LEIRLCLRACLRRFRFNLLHRERNRRHSKVLNPVPDPLADPLRQCSKISNPAVRLSPDNLNQIKGNLCPKEYFTHDVNG